MKASTLGTRRIYLGRIALVIVNRTCCYNTSQFLFTRRHAGTVPALWSGDIFFCSCAACRLRWQQVTIGLLAVGHTLRTASLNQKQIGPKPQRRLLVKSNGTGKNELL
jgi:hypothetical protein